MPGSTALARRQPSGLALSPLGLPLRYPRLSSVLALWLLGLYLAFLAKPPAKITEQQTKDFTVKVKQAEALMVDITAAEHFLMEAELEMRRHQVWFWWFRPEARREVEARRPAVEAARARVQAVLDRRDQLLREAKGELGLWSEAGVEEGRELFWESFASGKLFAQRQSFFDALFAILGSRERDWLGLLLQLLFQTLINFLTGMTVSVFVFLFQLPSLIWSYQPALWSGVTFFALAAVAAVSVVAAYLGLLFGAGATATYATLSLVAQQAQRLEAAEQQRRRITYEREHHE